MIREAWGASVSDKQGIDVCDRRRHIGGRKHGINFLSGLPKVRDILGIENRIGFPEFLQDALRQSPRSRNIMRFDE